MKFYDGKKVMNYNKEKRFWIKKNAMNETNRLGHLIVHAWQFGIAINKQVFDK